MAICGRNPNIMLLDFPTTRSIRAEIHAPKLRELRVAALTFTRNLWGWNSSDIRIPAIGYLYLEISFFVWSQCVRDWPCALVATDVVGTHARGAQVRTLGRVCLVRRIFFNDRWTSVIAIGVNHFHFYTNVNDHSVLVAVTYAPAKPDGIGWEIHTCNLISVHEHISLAQMFGSQFWELYTCNHVNIMGLSRPFCYWSTKRWDLYRTQNHRHA